MYDEYIGSTIEPVGYPDEFVSVSTDAAND